MSLYGAIEAGGTKFLVAVGNSSEAPRDITRIPTTTPAETIAAVVSYFRARGPLAALGVATFGPVDFATGSISSTPKLAWRGYPLRDALYQALRIPVALETDVNGAALGEARHGAGRGLEDLIYVTVGTGIGGGALCAGQLVHGLMHSEMGHLLVRRAAAEKADFPGVCPYHGDCLEGMASGPAMEARWGVPATQLPPAHAAWTVEADYLAQACFQMACVLSPRAIVLGGGVMEQAQLFPLIRARAAELGRDYLKLPKIVPPGLPYPALCGALALAQDAV